MKKILIMMKLKKKNGKQPMNKKIMLNKKVVFCKDMEVEKEYRSLQVGYIVFISLFTTFITNKLVRKNKTPYDLKSIRTVSILIINFLIGIVAYFLLKFDVCPLGRNDYLYIVVFVNFILILYYYKYRNIETTMDLFMQTSLKEYLKNKVNEK